MQGLLVAAAVPAGLSRGGNMWGWDRASVGKALHFAQRQDHFDAANNNSWQQAYYINDKHWAGATSGAPVFLWIGGEGPLGASSVTSNFVADWLPEKRALFLGVEHRYYGCHNPAACPYNLLHPEADHLRFLSSRQALADLATFHAFATKEYNLTAETRWIAFGGSYPGMLAAFLRAEYPDLFHASVASSAPVVGKLDMTEFQDVVAGAYALSVEGVEGSAACRDAIAEGHRAVGELLPTADGRAQLAALFPSAKSADWLADPAHQRAFAGCGVASFPAQSNNPRCAGAACGISQICAIMAGNATEPALHRLAALSGAQAGAAQHPDMVSSCEMDWEMPGDVPPAALNYWGYQTCTEFGFYQTCEKGTNCFYTQGLISFNNVDHKPNDFCLTQFNLSTAATVALIQKTDGYYGAKIKAATRIIWPNGNADPWSGLSHRSSPGAEQPVIWPVEGASHHAWTHPARDDDQQSVKDARTKIYTQVSAWLGEPR